MKLNLDIKRYGVVPNLSAKTITITNSSRGKMACKLQLWFSEIEQLRPTEQKWFFSYGQAWHDWLETRNRWFMQFDKPVTPLMPFTCGWCAGEGDGCSECEETGFGPANRAFTSWEKDVEEGLLEEDKKIKMEQTLIRAIEGHNEVRGLAPMQDWRVVAVEVKIAAPILNRKGRPLTPLTYLVETESGYRLARTGERSIAKEVRWPWVQVMTLDAVLEHRETGKLAVWEGKSGASPQTFVQNTSVDPQVAGYCWGLQQSLGKPGPFKSYDPNCTVVGYMFDVSSNRLQPDPKLLSPKKVQDTDENGEPLFKGKRKVYLKDAAGEFVMKSPGFSRASNTGVPSWRFQKALAKEGFSESDYADHIVDLASTVDMKLYSVDFGMVDQASHLRYTKEILSVAREMASLRRLATRSSLDDVPLNFPRTPICKFGGASCSFRSACLQDEQFGTDLQGYRRELSQEWLTDEALREKGVDTDEQDEEPSDDGGDNYWDW